MVVWVLRAPLAEAEVTSSMDLPADDAAAQQRPVASLSDEDVMRLVQERGDRRAFGLLVRRWQGPIRRLCTRMAGDADRGRDLAQDTFTKLLERAGAYRHDARFATFLWRMAVNVCLDARRRARVRAVQPLDTEAHGGAPSPDAVAAGRERAALVRAALDRLPEHYRAVVVLRHYEGLKFREVAEVLDIPEGTVKSRMAEALTRLRGMLGALE